MDLIARVAKHFEDSANTKLNALEQMAAPIAAARTASLPRSKPKARSLPANGTTYSTGK